jgi:predicted ATPase
LKELRFDKPVTFFVGENGSGKSTLLEAIAVNLGLNAEGGSRNFNFRTTESHSQLYENLKIIRGHKRPKDSYFLKAESFYNVATMKSKTIYLNIMAIKAFIPSRMRSLS